MICGNTEAANYHYFNITQVDDAITVRLEAIADALLSVTRYGLLRQEFAHE